MNKNLTKLFFWIFGIIFSGIFYFFSKTSTSLSYITEIKFLPYVIMLIIILLFFLIGILFSKIPFFWYSKFRKSNLNEVLSEVDVKKTEENIDQLVDKLKDAIRNISKSNYSQISINYLIKNVGISKESADGIVKNIKRLKRLKTLSISLGVIISLGLYFFVSSLPVFNIIPNYVFIISAVIIFLLFILEGYLITRMPDSFYLNLININKEKILEVKRESLEKEEKLNNYNQKQKGLLDNIQKATKFLLSQDVSKEAISNFFSKYDVDQSTISKFIEMSEKELNLEKNNSGKVLFNAKSDSAIRLTLSKIHDSFEQINQIYNEVSKLQKEVSEISQRQEKLEKMSTISVSKEVKKLKKEPIMSNKYKDLKKADPKEIKELLDKRNEEYDKLISYLYHLFLPTVETSSQNDVFSTLVYYGYPYEIVEDVLQKFKDKKITFGKDKKISFSEKLVNKINSFYDLFSSK